jgi:hypothetical protein
MWVRRMVSVVVIGLVLSGGGLSHDRAVANEPVPATPEPVPGQAGIGSREASAGQTARSRE